MVDVNLTLGYDVPMPTLFELFGFKVKIIPGDHEPSHVHVVKPGSNEFVIFIFECPKGPITLREASRSISKQDIKRLKAELEPRIKELCAGWRNTRAK